MDSIQVTKNLTEDWLIDLVAGCHFNLGPMLLLYGDNLEAYILTAGEDRVSFALVDRLTCKLLAFGTEEAYRDQHCMRTLLDFVTLMNETLYCTLGDGACVAESLLLGSGFHYAEGRYVYEHNPG